MSKKGIIVEKLALKEEKKVGLFISNLCYTQIVMKLCEISSQDQNTTYVYWFFYKIKNVVDESLLDLFSVHWMYSSLTSTAQVSVQLKNEIISRDKIHTNFPSLELVILTYR